MRLCELEVQRLEFCFQLEIPFVYEMSQVTALLLSGS
jgi:hypothetical protein